jgi:hypothetical protein
MIILLQLPCHLPAEMTQSEHANALGRQSKLVRPGRVEAGALKPKIIQEATETTVRDAGLVQYLDASLESPDAGRQSRISSLASEKDQTYWQVRSLAKARVRSFRQLRSQPSPIVQVGRPILAGCCNRGKEGITDWGFFVDRVLVVLLGLQTSCVSAFEARSRGKRQAILRKSVNLLPDPLDNRRGIAKRKSKE